MTKRFAVIFIIVAFLVGNATGAFGFWYTKIKVPQMKTMEIAKAEQERMNLMVRSGKVVDIKAGEITITVEHSGDAAVKAGTNITAKIDSATILQDGNDILNKPGQSIDTINYVKPGMYVDLLVDNNSALAIHWSAPSSQPQNQ